MKFVGIKEANNALSEKLREAQSEPVVLTSHGHPVAVVLGVDGKNAQEVVEEFSKFEGKKKGR